MKKYLTIIAAAAICLLTACSKEKELRAPAEVIAEESNPEFTHLPGWTYIGAQGGEEVATASSVDGTTAAFSWNTGDKIAIWVGDSYKVSAALDASFDGSANAEFAFEGEDIDANRADFAVYPASLVSSSSSANAHTAASLKITLPSVYTLAEVQGEVSPTPMIAVNAPGASLAFKSICPLLRITVKNVAWDAEYIKVRFPGLKVHGEFELADFVAGTSGIQASASTDEDDETITITDLNLNGTYAAQLVINLPVPMGSYADAVTSVCDNSGLRINYIVTPIKVVESVPTAWTPGRKAARKITADLPVFTVAGTKETSSTISVAGQTVKVPYGYISKADRKTIAFAPGNLQAKLQELPMPNPSDPDQAHIDNYGTASEWRFAEHQYDAIGATIPDGRSYSYNSLQAPVAGDWIDLFSWMGNDATASIKDEDDAYKYGVSYPCSSGTTGYQGSTVDGVLWNDWGENEISYANGSYSSGVWRTPTVIETMVLLSRRYKGTSGATGIDIACKAQIKISDSQTICGLLILPDNFSLPYCDPAITINKVHKGNSTKWKVSDGQSVCSDNEYTLAQWEKLEGAGCIFLPLTNSRKYNSSSDIATTAYPADAWYWTSSTRTDRYVNALAFNNVASGTSSYSNGTDNLTANQQADRQFGYAVRLVRYVKP